MTTTADAMQAWCDVPAQERHEWQWQPHSQRWWLPADGVSVTAMPMGDGRFQVYVKCTCLAGWHAWPADDLESAARDGLTVCARISQGR